MKTLVIAPAWVGDMVMAHTLIQRLALDECREIHVLAPPATAPLATRMAEVAQVMTAPFARRALDLRARYRLGRDLRSRRYDEAYVLPNSWKSALVPFFAGIPRRVGWAGELRLGLLNDLRRREAGAYPLMVERFMALADPDGALPAAPYSAPRLRADAANAERVVRELGLRSGRAVAMAPGAEFGPAKKWPAEHYAALARAVLDCRGQVWLLGSRNDENDCAAVARLAPGAANLAGRTSLLDAVDLLSLAEQAVCNDSGLMHVACALGVPTIGIYGSTSPDFTPPMGASARVVQIELECRPCFQRTCPLGHLNCLTNLGPERVIPLLQLT